MPVKRKNYNYVSTDAVVIITTTTEPEAQGILQDVVRRPLDFRLDTIEQVE